MCQVETYFSCSNAVMPSTCLLQFNITGTVAWVERKLDSNKVEFGIGLSTYFTNFNYMMFDTHVTTDLPCISGGLALRMDRNYLVLECDYSQTIEGNSYSLSLQMDQQYFTSLSYLTATLPASGMNGKLTYDNNTYLYEI